MAAPNESQGLKIAVAIFVMLTVVLAVSTYFSYRAYSEADAKLSKAETEKANALKAQNELITQVEGFRKDIGTKAEDYDVAKTEIKNAYKKADEDLNAMAASINDAITKAQGAGAQGQELVDAKEKVQAIIGSYRSEPNKTFISALDRLMELTRNLTMLQTQVALNYVDVKRTLESTNGVNAQKLDVETKALATAKQDLEAEQKKHVEERQTILSKIDQYTTDNARMQTEIANLTAQVRKLEEDGKKKLDLAQQSVRDLKARIEIKENVLDRPDGKVTYVDYIRGEIHCDVTRAMGARPQMSFAIFDALSPGLPTDKPKGTVELIQVNDTFSIAKIVKTNSTIDPIRPGDFVYSAAWSPNDPMRFALIGKIDMNRDGVDDRSSLKLLIEKAGGIVDYDLPPPEVGKVSGKVTGRDAWYVVDERMPLRDVYAKTNVTANEGIDFLKQQSEAIREARQNGVRPLSIERLLSYLGYEMLAPIKSGTEAVDLRTQKRIFGPRQNNPAAGGTATPPAPDAPKAEEPKAEMPKEEAK